MLKWFDWIAAELRFGRAGKMESRGALRDAWDLYEKNRRVLAAWTHADASGLALRLMNLACLARVSKQVGRPDVLAEALKEWSSVWHDAQTVYPGLSAQPALARWEGWVAEELTRIAGSEAPRTKE